MADQPLGAGHLADREENRSVSDSADLLALIRGRFLKFSPRARQGAPTRRSLSRPAVVELTGALRNRGEQGDRAAIACAIGALTGIHPNKIGKIPLTLSGVRGSPIEMDVAHGFTRMDLDQVLDRADRGPPNGTSELATRILDVRLPFWLCDSLAELHQAAPLAGNVADLVGIVVVDGRRPLLRGPGYRLRMTFSRFRHSLPQIAIETGIPRLVAALVCFDFQIVTKSNFAYVTIDRAEIDAATERLYDALGWGP